MGFHFLSGLGPLLRESVVAAINLMPSPVAPIAVALSLVLAALLAATSLPGAASLPGATRLGAKIIAAAPWAWHSETVALLLGAAAVGGALRGVRPLRCWLERRKDKRALATAEKNAAAEAIKAEEDTAAQKRAAAEAIKDEEEAAQAAQKAAADATKSAEDAAAKKKAAAEAIKSAEDAAAKKKAAAAIKDEEDAAAKKKAAAEAIKDEEEAAQARAKQAEKDAAAKAAEARAAAQQANPAVRGSPAVPVAVLAGGAFPPLLAGASLAVLLLAVVVLLRAVRARGTAAISPETLSDYGDAAAEQVAKAKKAKLVRRRSKLGTGSFNHSHGR